MVSFRYEPCYLILQRKVEGTFMNVTKENNEAFKAHFVKFAKKTRGRTFQVNILRLPN